MGINKIFDLIKKKSPNGFRETTIDIYNKKKIALDTKMVRLNHD